LSEGSLIDKLNMIDAQLRHEDDLIGLRMSWLVISQSFLFGTFATLVGMRSVAGRTADAIRLLLLLIPTVGVFVPILVLVAVGAATYAMSQWRAEHDRICNLPEAQLLDWPSLKRRKLVMVLGHALPIAASVGFLVAWLVILILVER
jgi:hypothetical protein